MFVAALLAARTGLAAEPSNGAQKSAKERAPAQSSKPAAGKERKAAVPTAPADSTTSSDTSVPGSLPSIEMLDALPLAEREAIGVDPRRGRGARNVETERAAQRGEAEGQKTAEPSKPAPVRTEPSASHRRQVALGPTNEDLAAGKDDPELSKLRAADLVMFPRPLPGLVPGWSWDLPRPVESALPEIVAGAPAVSLAVPAAPVQPAPSAGWLRGLTMPNLAVRMEDRVGKYLSFYRDSPSGRSIARVWAKKVGRYGPALRAELARAGLPTDLVWLSMIESGHNPTIVSPAGAAGLWQFMPDAGRAYGLVIDRWIDERLDPERSTEAACRYLSDLYRRFGTWDLAMAAYNMGYGGLSRAVRKYNTNDFWELARYEAGLPWETTLYVPKILATAVVMSNRRAFGLDDIEQEPAERYDTVLVAAGIPLREIARLASAPQAVIEALNPQYLSGRTPPTNRGRSWPVRVPVGSGASVTQALARDLPHDESLFAYVVRAGDTVEGIARARGTTEQLIRSINGIDAREVLAAGSVLLVPRGEAVEASSADDTLVVVPPREFGYPDRKRVFYRVVAGDSVGKIAELFRVAQPDVLLWNALDGTARLHTGMALQIFVSRTQNLSHVRHLSESEARILVAGSPQFFEHYEGQNGKKRLVVKARTGDSLALIGKRYGMSVGSMERVNRRSRTDAVRAGEPIVVYTERTAPAAGDSLYVDALARAASSAPGGDQSNASAGIAARRPGAPSVRQD